MTRTPSDQRTSALRSDRSTSTRFLLLFLFLNSCSTSSNRGEGMGGASGEDDTPQTGQTCEFGEDEAKCDARSDVSCLPGLIETGAPCESDTQCDDDQLCLVETPGARSGECFFIRGQCLPRCGGDFDCSDGQYCDPQSGECTDERPTGLEYGQACALDENECRGACVEFRDGSTECEERCRVGAESGCGQESLQGSGVACAYFAYDLSDIEATQGSGDTGICSLLCHCDSDCPGAQRCYPLPTDDYEGICTGGLAEGDGLSCGGGGASGR